MAHLLIVWRAAEQGVSGQLVDLSTVQRTARQVGQLLSARQGPQSVAVLSLCGAVGQPMLEIFKRHNGRPIVGQLAKMNRPETTDFGCIGEIIRSLFEHDVLVLVAGREVAEGFPAHYLEHHLPKNAKVRHLDLSTSVAPGEAVALSWTLA